MMGLIRMSNVRGRYWLYYLDRSGRSRSFWGCRVQFVIG